MKQITIRIDTVNAAFEEPGLEIARILHVLADRAEAGRLQGWEESHNIADINGNRVGTVKIR